ncbi:MAG: tetratricopeptide repeat protein [Crocosphaera sp.]|nr:tetratricopeptide repeat protein [Crocosphaera sp.]
METPVEQQKSNNENSQNNLSDIFDLLSGIGLVSGAVGSFFGNAAFAAIPISFSLALQMANRRQLKVELAQAQQTSAIQINSHKSVILEQFQELSQKEKKVQTIINDLLNKIQEHQQLFENFKTKEKQLEQFTESLESQQKEIQEIVKNLQQIENFSQIIRTNPEEVEAYYQRGLSHQKLGDKTGAIEDYTEALHLDSTYAKAYHNRGILLAEMGNKKQAVEDLRLAAKYYFEQGDIESYEKAKHLSKEFYEIRHYNLNDEVTDSGVSEDSTREETSSDQASLMTVGSLFDDDEDVEQNVKMLS